MRRRVPLISLLLTAVLLAGQWLCAVHNSDHALQGATPACSVCVAAHGAGHGALPATPRVVLGATTEAPELSPAAAAVTVTVRLHPIRGPPALLS